MRGLDGHKEAGGEPQPHDPHRTTFKCGPPKKGAATCSPPAREETTNKEETHATSTLNRVCGNESRKEPPRPHEGMRRDAWKSGGYRVPMESTSATNLAAILQHSPRLQHLCSSFLRVHEANPNRHESGKTAGQGGFLVEPRVGIEPTTVRLQARLSHFFKPPLTCENITAKLFRVAFCSNFAAHTPSFV